MAVHRDKPFICCEYTHSMGNSNGAMSKYTDLAQREPLYQGGFIWDFIDQAILKKTGTAGRITLTAEISATADQRQFLRQWYCLCRPER